MRAHIFLNKTREKERAGDAFHSPYNKQEKGTKNKLETKATQRPSLEILIRFANGSFLSVWTWFSANRYSVRSEAVTLLHWIDHIVFSMCITARRFIINVGLERIGYEQIKEFKLMDRCLQVRDVVRLLD